MTEYPREELPAHDQLADDLDEFDGCTGVLDAESDDPPATIPWEG